MRPKKAVDPGWELDAPARVGEEKLSVYCGKVWFTGSLSMQSRSRVVDPREEPILRKR
jgi:hypothetical protein